MKGTETCHLVAFAPIISKRFERPALAFKKDVVNTTADAPISATPGGIKSMSGVTQPASTHLESKDYRSVSPLSPCRLKSSGVASIGPLNFLTAVS